MKKRIFRALYNTANSVLNERDMKKIDNEMDSKVNETINELKKIKPVKKKSGKK